MRTKNIQDVNLLLDQRTRFALFGAIFLLATALAIVSENYFLAGIPFALLLFFAGTRSIKSVFFLLLCFLPFSFEYNFNPSLGTDLPDEPLMLLVSAITICYLLYDHRAIRKQQWNHPLMLLLLASLGWIVICTINSTHPLLSFKFLLAKGWYIIAFVLATMIVLKNQRDLATAVRCILFPMIFVAVLALIRHAGDGFSFASVNRSLTPFFRNHVNYSAMLVCCIPLAAAFFTLSGKKSHRRLLFAAILVMVAALFFSYSRGAWLALGTGAIAYLLVRKGWLFYSFIIVCLMISFAISWLVRNDHYLQFSNDFKTTIYHKEFGEHIVATYKLKDISTAERFNRWVAGVRMVPEHPVSGHGPGTFYEEYKPYTVPAFRTWVSDNKEHSTVHNYFILLAVEQGYPGLILFLVLVGAMIFFAERYYHRRASLFEKTTAITIAVIIVMLVTVNFLSDLVETDKIGSIFYLCIGTLISMSAGVKDDREHSVHREDHSPIN